MKLLSVRLLRDVTEKTRRWHPRKKDTRPGKAVRTAGDWCWQAQQRAGEERPGDQIPGGAGATQLLAGTLTIIPFGDRV